MRAGFRAPEAPTTQNSEQFPPSMTILNRPLSVNLMSGLPYSPQSIATPGLRSRAQSEGDVVGIA